MVFPRLPILESILRLVGDRLQRDLKDTLLVCGQHLLESTGSLFESLLQAGARADAIFVLGKCYSSSDIVVDRLRALGIATLPGSAPHAPGWHQRALEQDVRQLWSLVGDRANSRTTRFVIVLDDATRISQFAPSYIDPSIPVVAIEQTTSGVMTRDCPYPLIDVACSGVKRLIEPTMIADAVVDKLRRHLPRPYNELRIGLLGLGAIGGALSHTLSRMDVVVSGYDLDEARESRHAGLTRLRSARELLHGSDVVIGCTGTPNALAVADVVRGLDGDKMLVSCSTSDIEFRPILQAAGTQLPSATVLDAGPCRTIAINDSNAGYRLRLPRSGFPINFDNSMYSVPNDRIQLTRALLLGAIFQALALLRDGVPCNSAHLMLDPKLQQFCAMTWDAIGAGREARAALPFDDVKWIASASSGTYFTASPIFDDLAA